MAGTTPVTIHEEVVPSSEGIRGNCALSTDEILTSSICKARSQALGSPINSKILITVVIAG